MKPAINGLIQKAKEGGLSKLIDEGVPLSREVAVKGFSDLGFREIRKYQISKFDKSEIVIDLQLELK